MKKITLLISGLILFSAGMFAQRQVKVESNVRLTNPHGNRCSTTEAMKMARDLDPGFFDTRKALKESQLQNWISNNYNASAKKAIITIPVVVQIWENTSSVPDTRVTEQIDRLNADFGRTNTDAGNTPGVFSAVDTEIQFCLANKDENGNATSGIVRKTANGSPSGTNTSVGAADFWDTDKYLNILVYDIGGGILGFTYTSSSVPNQGVHIDPQYFGNTGGQFGLGRTASHEVGHWLNLEHIWGGGNGCGTDFVADTPLQAGPNSSNCPNFPSASSCSGTSNGPNGDMFMNYMDYVIDGCMNAFTAGQKTRMTAAINNDRPGLLNSAVTNCATAALTSEFSANITTINAGQSVIFTDASTPLATINSWNWDFDVANLGGVTAAAATTQGAHTVTYNNTGTYTVSLQVGDGSTNDTETKTSYIIVQSAGSTLCDTISNYNDAFFTPSLNGSAGWGWVSGHNDYDDIGKADFYSVPASGYEITGAEFYFAKNHDGSGSGTIDVKIWDGTSGSPGTELASKTINISSLNLYPTKTSVTFNAAVSVTNNYFLGIEFSSNGSPQDSIALIHSSDSVDLFAGQGTAWELWGDNSWHAFEENPDSWSMDVALAIFPILCTSVTGNNEISGNIGQLSIYPNPSIGTLNFGLTTIELSTVSVYNMLGAEVFNATKNTQLFTVDMNNQPNGVYFVKVKTGNDVITKKVILSK